MGGILINIKYPQMNMGGRENKRQSKIVYYSCNCSPRKRGERIGKGKKKKKDEEIIAWNFPKLKNDIKAKNQEPPGTAK